MLQSIVYLTCEIKGRDLDSRSLIAAHLVKRGYTVVVGQCWNLNDNASAAPKGCFHFKTSNRIQGNWLLFAKLQGHATIAADEEALSSSEALAASTTDQQAIENCDLFIALNAGHKRALDKAFPAAASRVRIGGTARADILRAVDFPAPLDRPYVLFNTSFGMLNSTWGSLAKATQVYAEAMRWNLKDPEHAKIMQSRLAYEHASLRETRLLLDWFLSETDIDVVIRPHPTEKAAWWKKHYRQNSRFAIVKDSDPYPWMQHAKLLVHSDSTSGVEAAVMSTPSVNLSPLDDWADRLVLRSINFSAETAAQAAHAIRQFLEAGGGPISGASWTDPFPLNCAEATARLIASLLPPPQIIGPVTWRPTKRGAVQARKFTVSPEEFRASVSRAFDLAGSAAHTVEDLTDSVVLIRPKFA